MEKSTYGLSYSPKYAQFHPFSFSHSNEPKDSFKYGENTMNYHHRSSSESFLFDEQPSWLDDLLQDPESPFTKSHHRRSASDSLTYLEEAGETITSSNEPKYGAEDFCVPAVSQNPLSYRDLCTGYIENKGASLLDKNNQEQQEDMILGLDLGHSRDECSPLNLELSVDRDAGSQAKSAGSKADPKRKQNNAQRSRVRKLQYITHLEKTIELLKAEGSGISAELEFIEQQNMILTMENRALKQRLENLSQEQLIKQWEQGMLEREIARLQTLYHLQNQQQIHMQQQHQQKQQLKQRRNKSRDLDHHPNASSMNKNDATSGRGSLNGHV